MRSLLVMLLVALTCQYVVPRSIVRKDEGDRKKRDVFGTSFFDTVSSLFGDPAPVTPAPGYGPDQGLDSFMEDSLTNSPSSQLSSFGQASDLLGRQHQHIPGQQTFQYGQESFPYQPDQQAYQPGHQAYQPGQQTYQYGQQPYQPSYQQDQHYHTGQQFYQPGQQPYQPGQQPYQPEQQPPIPSDQPVSEDSQESADSEASVESVDPDYIDWTEEEPSKQSGAQPLDPQQATEWQSSLPDGYSEAFYGMQHQGSASDFERSLPNILTDNSQAPTHPNTGHQAWWRQAEGQAWRPDEVSSHYYDYSAPSNYGPQP